MTKRPTLNIDEIVNSNSCIYSKIDIPNVSIRTGDLIFIQEDVEPLEGDLIVTFNATGFDIEQFDPSKNQNVYGRASWKLSKM